MSHLRITNQDGVRILTIDRPDSKNAVNSALQRDLINAFAALDADDSVRVAILTGVDTIFSAGVDFKEAAEPQTGDKPNVRERDPNNPARAARAVRKPLIAAVNGACVAGALEIALSCTFIVASDKARFADTHARLNIVPTWGLTALLSRAIGVRKAIEMSVTGNFVLADEALRLGLVNHVVAHNELMAFTLKLAGGIPGNDSVAEFLEIYELGEDLTVSSALANQTKRSYTREVDVAAFAAAGRANVARIRAQQHEVAS